MNTRVGISAESEWLAVAEPAEEFDTAPRASSRTTETVAESRLADNLARVLTAGLLLALAWRIGQDFLATGRPTGLLLLTSELLVVIFTIARRPAFTVDRRLHVRIVAALSVIGPPLLMPMHGPGLASELVTATASAIGLLIAITAKLSLGRSFGLMPANRGVVCSGLYGLVRHPIYFGYLITHISFVCAHPGFWNLAVLVVADVALMVRATYEEDTLRLDAEYAGYMTRVRWRILPGVF